MPFSKAQAFANTGGRASAITMLLKDEEDAEAVAAALQSPKVNALTWRSLNEVLLTTIETGTSFYVFLYGIVILIVAVIIANTLLMAVFERIREIGILARPGHERTPDHADVPDRGPDTWLASASSSATSSAQPVWRYWQPTASPPAIWAQRHGRHSPWAPP